MRTSLCSGRSGKSCQEISVNEEWEFCISVWAKSYNQTHVPFRGAYCLQLTAGEADWVSPRTTGTHVTNSRYQNPVNTVPFATDGDNIQVLCSSVAFYLLAFSILSKPNTVILDARLRDYGLAVTLMNIQIPWPLGPW